MTLTGTWEAIRDATEMEEANSGAHRAVLPRRSERQAARRSLLAALKGKGLKRSAPARGSAAAQLGPLPSN